MTMNPETVHPETEHPEISHLAKEERIRAIAYAIWEEDGRPDGRAEEHWLKACDLVEAEASATEPDWLKRAPADAATPEPVVSEDPVSNLSEAIKRMKSSRAA